MIQRLMTVVLFLVVFSLVNFAQQTNASQTEFKIWKTVTIGSQSKEVLIDRLTYEYELSGWALDVIPNIRLGTEKTKIQLVKVSGVDLGFTEWVPGSTTSSVKIRQRVTRDEIYKAATAKGLKLVPAETALYLRLKYDNQPDKENLLVAMEPIPLNDNNLIFSITNWDGNKSLSAIHPTTGKFSADTIWLFAIK